VSTHARKSWPLQGAPAAALLLCQRLLHPITAAQGLPTYSVCLLWLPCAACSALRAPPAASCHSSAVLLQCCAARHLARPHSSSSHHMVLGHATHASIAPIANNRQSHTTHTNGTTQPASWPRQGRLQGTASLLLRLSTAGVPQCRTPSAQSTQGPGQANSAPHRCSCALPCSQRPLSAGVSARWLLPAQQQIHAGVCTMQLVHTCHVCSVHSGQKVHGAASLVTPAQPLTAVSDGHAAKGGRNS
jgi:hypothetical protein